jgi:hypothetical protein
MLHLEVEKTNPWGIFGKLFSDIPEFSPSRRSRQPTNKNHVALGKCNFKAFRRLRINHSKVLKTHKGGYFHYFFCGNHT